MNDNNAPNTFAPDEIDQRNTSSSPPSGNGPLDVFRKDPLAKSVSIKIPSIPLPKGGGALKSIDEKFQVNSANGTAAINLTIPLSRSRSDFGPGLSLSYNSGSGNSPFGLGWNISLPSIRRRTDKILPTYRDATNSDIFQITGAEDLVPILTQNQNGQWVQVVQFPAGYQVKTFRPRIEAEFTLIEQVTSSAGMYWKTTSKENIVTFFGLTAQARVADPADGSRIFEWLPEITYDDKGNCTQYLYVPEDLSNVPNILHEGNRLNGNQPVANTYLKRVAYGNKIPYNPVPAGGNPDPYNPFIPDNTGYLFFLVLDYGDHDPLTPLLNPSISWACRLDPFSNGKPGFDQRTYRLCRRFLMFHGFTELDTNPVVVKSLDLTYEYCNFQPAADPYSLTFAEADFITSVTETGWTGTGGTGYQTAAYPPLGFSYQLPVWNKAVDTIAAGNRINIPKGLLKPYQFTDLYNEGISGVLSEQSEGWYYNNNLGEGIFTPARLIAPRPSFTGLASGNLQLESLTGDGRKFIVSTRAPNQGYFELGAAGEWQPFQAFQQFPAIDLNDPNVKLIDLNGDGMPDIVLSEEQVFTWYPAAGTIGYDSPEAAPKPFDEEKGPAIVFADPVQSIYLADMTGDGLTDIVRIRNGEISYWPNHGYGIFGAKVNMSYAPVFDKLDQFNPAYLQLADINGTGATDILYLGQDRLRAWLNLSGNAWGEPFEAPAFPDTASPNQLSVTDFLGNGTACIVWSSPLAAEADNPMRYIDLMGGHKPYLMKTYTNGMGKEVCLGYRSSTWYYLRDKLAGTPWITELCFPVQCVACIKVTDSVSGTTYSSSYTYHHGYYDHPEKEYRGFARVEQTDTDLFSTDAIADQTPVLTRTWYHTGVYFGVATLLDKLSGEYFQNPSFSEYELPDPVMPAGMTEEEAREAARACKGMILRQEVYALDAAVNPVISAYPYSAAEHNNVITLLQPQGPNLYAVFLSRESELITYHYERNPADPRIAHTLNTAYDPYGNLVDTYSVAYARQPVNPSSPGGVALPGGQSLPAAVIAQQLNTYIIYTHYGYTTQIIAAATYRLPVNCEKIESQWTGGPPGSGNSPGSSHQGAQTQTPKGYFILSDFTNPAVAPALSKLRHQRTLFLQNDFLTVLPLGTMDALGLVYQEYHLAFNAGVTALKGKATTAIFQAGQYIESDTYIAAGYFPAADATGEWWLPSGRINYLNAGASLPFLLPYQYLDAYGYATTLGYDKYWLLMISVTDPLNNQTTASPMDYRVLSPKTVTDPNQNATDFRYDILGLVVGIALRGKGEGDAFQSGFTADLTTAQINGFFSAPLTNGPPLLQGATSRYVYQFPAASSPGVPFSAGAITRKTHLNQTPETWGITAPPSYQFTFEYTDGLGRAAMTKIQGDANTGPASAISCDGSTSPQPQWIGKGKTVYNNKGNPVMQYEPYFSATSGYEEAPANGVSPILYYDPIARLIKTVYPDGSLSTTAFYGWMEIVFDRNDNTQGSPWYAANNASPDPHKVDAAAKALAHTGTPTVNHVDTLARKFDGVAFNIVSGGNQFYNTYIQLDLNGNPLSVTDARGNTVMQYDYDLLDRVIHQLSMDSGEQWMLHDAMDKPVYQWDANSGNNYVHQFQYDNLHRPSKNYIQINAGNPLLYTYTIYGENISIGGATDMANNLRGRIYRQFDDSGLVTHYLYDFKGNLVQSSRIFATNYKSADGVSPVNVWSGTTATDMALLETDPNSKLLLEYTSLTHYDALNRTIMQVRPFLSPAASIGAVIPAPYTQAGIANADVLVPTYGDSGLLNLVDAFYIGGNTPTAYVNRICHNEKGQRLCIQYGNNTVTRYSYDPDTFRLVRLLTTSNTGQTTVQDLSYYYDPIGNVTYLADNSKPTPYYSGQAVPADGDYTYDPVYRLIIAKGREQIAQNTINESASNGNYRNFPFAAVHPMPAPTDPLAMRAYTQYYSYDATSNMTKFQHAVTGGGYTRVLTYNNTNNQLITTQIGANPAIGYNYDTHGNMINLPQLPAMGWNFKDQLVSVTQQVVANGGLGRTTYYNYDANGMRIRKVTEGPAAAGNAAPKISERLYIGNFEIYREFAAAAVTLQRETLHVMDDKSRIAMIDNKTIDTAGAASSDKTVLNTYYPRFQLGNQLGSCLFELDMTADLISSEEYHPFGTTSYHAGDATLDVPRKRYRYTGKERDDESGLYYHGARYYAPWLCRWTAADPIGVGDGLNVYEYVRSGPLVFRDPKGTNVIGDVWNDTVEGSKILFDAVHKGAESAGNYIVDKASEKGQELAHGGHPILGEVLTDAGIVGGTLTTTLAETAGGILLSGPAAVTTLDSAGTDIGEGTARIVEAKNTDETLLGVAQVAGGVGQGALVAVQALSLTSGAGLKGKLNTGGSIVENNAAGQAFEEKAAGLTNDIFSDQANQITIRPNIAPNTPGPASSNFRIDTLNQSRLTSTFELVEAKGSATAPLSKNQIPGFQLVEEFGGTVQGRPGAPVFPGGTQIPPTPVTVLRQNELLNKFTRSLVGSTLGSTAVQQAQRKQ
jgi:RHS repeat-associated protein